MSESKTVATIAIDKSLTEYEPFGAKDKIILSINIVKNLIAVHTKKGCPPTDKDCLRFIAMCRAKRLNPFEGDAFMIGYDTNDGPQFSLITAHQTYLKRAETHPEFDGMESGVIVDDAGQIKELEGDFHIGKQTVIGGWAKVFFKSRKHPMYKRIRLARFQKTFGVWRDDPGGMICKCAEADALRSAFPTMLGGLYLREEIEAPQVYSKPVFEQSKPQLFEHSEQPEDHLKTVRGLLGDAKLDEASFMGALIQLGSCAPEITTLDILNEKHPEIMEMIVNQWQGILRRIQELEAEK